MRRARTSHMQCAGLLPWPERPAGCPRPASARQQVTRPPRWRSPRAQALVQLSPPATSQPQFLSGCCPADRAGYLHVARRAPATPDVRYLLCASTCYAARKRVTSAALLWTLAAAPRVTGAVAAQCRSILFGPARTCRVPPAARRSNRCLIILLTGLRLVLPA
jgi:hypothetical protein